MKYLHIFQIAFSCIFSDSISTNLCAQSPIQVTLECDSATTTIFYQDFVRVKFFFPDSIGVMYYWSSAIEVSIGEKDWICEIDPVQNSHCDGEGYLQTGQSTFGIVNLPAIFFKKNPGLML